MRGRMERVNDRVACCGDPGHAAGGEGRDPPRCQKPGTSPTLQGSCGSLLSGDVDVFFCLVSLRWTALQWSQTCSHSSFLPSQGTAFLGSVVLGDRSGAGASLALRNASRFGAGSEQAGGKQACVRTLALGCHGPPRTLSSPSMSSTLFLHCL